MKRQWIHVLVIALLGLLAYSSTFNVPFHRDDVEFIVNNAIVKDLSNFKNPITAEGLGSLKNRYIGYLTFALNYKIHGLDVTGYHIVNIAIHLLNAMLVYFLVMLTLKTPHLKESSLKENNGYVALFSALLFVSHPVQTEAVTYIFQRLASLTAFFCLLSLVLYITWRLRQDRAEHVFSFNGILLYLSSILSLALAMKTKENAFMFPVIIALYEFFFFKGAVKKRILFLVPILLTMLIIPLTTIGISKPLGEMMGSVGATVAGYKGIGQADYLLTQLRVIVTYLRLLLFPSNQNIDHDYPIYHSVFEVEVLSSLLLLLLIAGAGTALLYGSKRSAVLRLGAFGIFWFLIALSVESSIIPLPMVINEYRLYLPSVGFFTFAAAGVGWVYEIVNDRKLRATVIACATLIILALSYSAYQRNNVWQSEITLWEDVVRKSPHIPRWHYNLGNAYRNNGLTEKAVAQYEAALRINPDYADAHNNLGITYGGMGLIDEAIEHFQKALALEPGLALAHKNLGIAYARKDMPDKAIEHYHLYIKMSPDSEAHVALALLYLKKGLTDNSRDELLKALKIDPNNQAAKEMMLTILMDLKRQ